jgi:hypothetical protein
VTSFREFEAAVVEAWRDTLGLRSVALHSNFFDPSRV